MGEARSQNERLECALSSAVERWSPKPNVVGSIPTGREFQIFLLAKMSEINLVNRSITLKELKDIASLGFGDMVKAVVDVEKRIMAIGGSMHADEEKFLLEQGASQDDLWGINIYPDSQEENRIEFDSMINVRPRQNNRSRGVESIELQKKIIEIVDLLIKE